MSVAGATHAVRLPVTAYTPEDGLAGHRVLRIVADSTGFLWFCTPDGLSRFDGQRFTTYSVGDGLPIPAINDLLETRDGVYWAATNGGGLAWFDPSRQPTPTGDDAAPLFSPVPVRGFGRGSERVNVVFEDAEGTLWAGTDAGLFASVARDDPRNPGTVSFDPIPLGVPGRADSVLQVWSIVESPEGSLWIGTSEGLVRRSSDGATGHLAIRPTEGADHVFALLLDPDGRLWIGHDTGVFVLRPSVPGTGDGTAGPLATRAAPCSPEEGTDGAPSLPAVLGDACHWRPRAALVGAAVHDLMQAADGRIQIAMGRGLAEFDGRRFRRVPGTAELDDAGITSLARDPSGNLWMGTWIHGALRLVPHGFLTYTEDDGLGRPLVDRVFSDPGGDVYAVTGEFLLHRFDGRRFVAIRPRLPGDIEWSGRSRYFRPYRDRSGAWWFATGRGLLRFPRVSDFQELAEVDPAAIYTVRDGLAGNDVRHLYEDARGDLWIGTRVPGREVLTRWDRRTGELHRYGPDDGLRAGNHPNSFAEDPSGNLWIGFGYGGLARFRDGEFTFYGPGEGLPGGGVTELLPDPGGGLWIGTQRGHLVHLDEVTPAGLRTTPLLPAAGIAVSPIRCLTSGGDGVLYAGTGRGLLRIDPASQRVERFGVAEGLGSGWIRSCTHDRNGDLWVATSPGISRLRSGPPRGRDPPPVRIASVEVGGVPRPISPLGERDPPPLELTGRDQRIRIEFFGVSFAPGEVLQYETRLAGGRPEWSPPQVERSVIYAGLSPGAYRFAVRAVTAGGVRSTEAATLRIMVHPPVWQRPPALGLAALLLGAVLLLGHRLRLRRAVELERVRTRIAADLHDDIGSGLARISILSEVAERRTGDGEAASFMRQIGESARSLLHSTDDIVWAIDPREETVAGLARRLRRFAADLLRTDGIDWSLEIDDAARAVALAPGQRRHLLLVLKEALHNVVRHADATRVRMSLRQRRGALLVEVEDDGEGLPVTDGGPETDGTGHGIANMRRRVRELGGELALESSPGTGTRLRFEARLRGGGT